MTRSRVTLGNITSGQTPGSGELSVPTADNSSGGHPVIRRPSYPWSENIPECLDKTGPLVRSPLVSPRHGHNSTKIMRLDVLVTMMSMSLIWRDPGSNQISRDYRSELSRASGRYKRQWPVAPALVQWLTNTGALSCSDHNERGVIFSESFLTHKLLLWDALMFCPCCCCKTWNPDTHQTGAAGPWPLWILLTTPIRWQQQDSYCQGGHKHVFTTVMLSLHRAPTHFWCFICFNQLSIIDKILDKQYQGSKCSIEQQLNWLWRIQLITVLHQIKIWTHDWQIGWVLITKHVLMPQMSCVWPMMESPVFTECWIRFRFSFRFMRQ